MSNRLKGSLSHENSNTVADLHDLTDKYVKIQIGLKTELERLKNEKFPHGFSKPIDVLEAVDANVNGQWEDRLQQASQSNIEKHIVLIPYYLGNSHWTGILIVFNDRREIERAEYVNPVSTSEFPRSQIQQLFNKICPHMTLFPIELQKHDNPTQSQQLTIQNLLTRVEELQLTNAEDRKSADTSGELFSHQQKHNSQHLENVLKSQIVEPTIHESSEQQSSGSGFYHSKQTTNVNLSKSSQQEGDTITTASLKNLYNDFFSMPPCSEKCILTLMYLFSLKLIGDTIVPQDDILIPDNIDSEIRQEFQSLSERLEIEVRDLLQIQELIGSAAASVNEKNWHSALSELGVVLEKIRPLNIQELFRLVEKVGDAAQKIKGKKIILFLGGTGSGKSTTIHFLGGTKFEVVKVKGIKHFQPAKIINPDLNKITTTPFTRSETRYITPVKVFFGDVGGVANDSVLLCDCPGFDDTGGPEVDIANGIGILKAIRGCKEVKPVVLISYKSIGDRLSGVKDLAHMLVGIVPGIEDHIDMFSYIFTKFPSDEQNDIHALLVNAQESMNDMEKRDDSFCSLFDDMVLKTRKLALVLDPIYSDAHDILFKLARSKGITHPDKTFKYCLTVKSNSVLKEQMNTDHLSAEQLLRVLLQREGKVNYEKLIKCLLTIQSAGWVNNYRDGEQSEIMKDLKEQLIEHIQQLKASIMEVPLDLDNYNKLELVYKTVWEINEMKHFQIIFTDINNYLEDVNSWFEDNINAVCTMIKCSFTIEEWKKQEHKSLDFSKAEKWFHYLDACKNIRIRLKIDYISILNSLEDCVKYYSNLVEEELKSCFDDIRYVKNNNNDKEIFEKARKLSCRLHEILEIKTEYSRSFSCFSNLKILEHWQNNLSSYQNELADEMARLSIVQQAGALKDQLWISQALSKLDNFLDGGKFRDMYVNYRDKFLSRVSASSEKVADAIRQHDYERIAGELMQL
ncbi:unnamed protein product, partial [Rotaria sp. Silwood2]